MKKWLQQYRFQIIIAIFSFGLYFNTFTHQYAYDDAIVITANPRVQSGFSGIPSLFKNYKTNNVSDHYGYRPIVLTSYAIEIGIAGLNPSVSHVSNAIFYSLLCLLLFKLLQAIFENKSRQTLFWMVMIYASHPLHTEVVANIKSRDEIFAFIFISLSILYFLKEKNKLKNALISVFWFILAFLSKESALSALPLLLLIHFYKNEINLKKIFRVSIGVLALGLLSIGIWKISHSEKILKDETNSLVHTGEYHEDGFLANPLKKNYARSYIFPTSVIIIEKAIKLFFIPNPLLHDYGYNQIKRIDGNNPLFIIGVVCLFLFFGFAFWKIKKRGAFLFGLLFFGLSFFGYLHLIYPGNDIFAERFLFIPSFGLAISSVAFLEFLERKMPKIPFKTTVSILVLCVFSYLTVSRNKAWANNGALFSTDIPKLKECARANYNYGTYLEYHLDDFPESTKNDSLNKVIGLYKRAIEISDRTYPAFIHLGKIYEKQGLDSLAIDMYIKASKVNLLLSEPNYLLGMLYLKKEYYLEALKYFEMAKNNGWAKIDNYYYMAVCQIKLGSMKNAIEILEKGLAFKPDQYQYFDLLSDLYFLNANYTSFEWASNKAIELNSTSDLLNKYSSRKNTLESKK